MRLQGDVAAGEPTAIQFPLPLAWPDDARDVEFLVTDSNRHAVQLLQQWRDWPVRTALLVGPPGSGRTLLAQVFAAQSGGRVIDDADLVDEQSLFHAWNDAQATQTPLLLVAAAAAPAWSVALPDLRTRLAASPVAQIGAPDEALVRALLERGSARRRLDARDDLIDWLVPRLPRRHQAVAQMLDGLEQAALSGRRRVTIPLARDLLSALFGAAEDPTTA
ncbi:chromosomal replication initiator DnaA [uncultured Sphingomonas sp.]|uniref:HdaA/DnaA family protein n=1 Tax=uncultured Sphingomonas sp. TaxID=158754 RepID=UPI00262A028F|nr:chromosomal replication initiator DnaA [uncultured Sphingomonas sp.]